MGMVQPKRANRGAASGSQSDQLRSVPDKVFLAPIKTRMEKTDNFTAVRINTGHIGPLKLLQ